jgi:cytochrome c-type biogenesis protein CcmF
MISGILGVSIAFVAAAVSSASYWLYYRENEERFYQFANRAFTVMGIGILFSSTLLYYNIFSHNFQLNYVYSYTSLKLSNYYLLSTFWAGQEGTFLLWLFFGTLFGIILIRSVGRREPLVMFFVMLVQTFILLILLKKSPFTMIWHTNEGLNPGFMPADGASLNPLLQNPWMIIHPPVMFVGYSSTVVAFAFAMNAMVKKEFAKWAKDARPWVIFSTLFLGMGIIMGAYWSYVTLGWGGYWAWDPVENASFVPWMFAAALLHGLVIQIRQEGLKKTNLFLAGLTFISVLWGSFLTRSGVLADFSVHSFAASDLNLYLITFVVLFSGIFLYFYFRSIRLIDSPKFAEGILSRETFILIGLVTLLITGLIVFIATSSPIYTGLLGQPSNVSIDFYNLMSIPISIAILASLAIAPLLVWKVSELRDKKTLLFGIIGASVVTIISIIAGLTKPVSVVLVFLSLIVVVVHSMVAVKLLKKMPVKTGAYLSHIGIGLMIVGIITSSMYNRSEKISLPSGEIRSSDFGYELQFVEFEQRSDGKARVRLQVNKNDQSYQANPQFYFSEYTNSYMISPHVKVGLVKDIYISPISYIPENSAAHQRLVLAKRESKTVNDLTFTFHKFIVGEHMTDAPMSVKADLTVVVSRENYQKEYSLQPSFWLEETKFQSADFSIPDADYNVHIESIDASAGTVTLVIHGGMQQDQQTADILSIEISEKPFISILWIGCVVLLVGITVSMIDRVKKK